MFSRRDQSGKGIAMLTLTENAVTRHSEIAASTSDAATASISRDEARGARWPLKPAAPSDRFMAGNPYKTRANHPPKVHFTLNRRQDYGSEPVEKWRNGRKG
jgi:hypothetical protein